MRETVQRSWPNQREPLRAICQSFVLYRPEQNHRLAGPSLALTAAQDGEISMIMLALAIIIKRRKWCRAAAPVNNSSPGRLEPRAIGACHSAPVAPLSLSAGFHGNGRKLASAATSSPRSCPRRGGLRFADITRASRLAREPPDAHMATGFKNHVSAARITDCLAPASTETMKRRRLFGASQTRTLAGSGRPRASFILPLSHANRASRGDLRLLRQIRPISRPA